MIKQFKDIGLGEDTRRNELIDYALMAAFMVVAAGIILPGLAGRFGSILSQIGIIVSETLGSGV
jgi:hypothetical protein